ncbi:MAG: hypothetical protein V2I32_16555, partial [Desulforhopalus sp.]|nr:hypothetical protein [Desulforhopalus sp.]
MFPRDRLFRVLADREKMAAVWVCGPAGSGKTTLINSYLVQHTSACIWYQLDESDGDIASFFYHLGRAAAALLSGGSVDFPLLTPEFFPNIPVFTRRFFETLRCHLQTPCAIVLDNYQEVHPATPLHEVLCTAIDVLVPGIGLYVCSRQKPPPQLTRHRANRSLQIIGWQQLRLDLDEACGIAARFIGPHYPRPDVEILQSKSDGWVVGLLLLLQRGEIEDIKAYRLLKDTPSEIFDYFGSVLFERLDPAVQHSLIRLSHLPRISPLAAEKLAGAKAPEILEKLHAANAFTYRTVGEQPTYSFHPLFQEFLQSRCRQRCTGAEVRQIQSMSAATLAEEGISDDAVSLYLQAGQVEEAITLILAQAPQMSMQGRFFTLSGWLDALPDDLAETLPWLVFWRGVVTVPYRPRIAQGYFTKALALFEEQGDPPGCYLALAGIIEGIVFAAEDYSLLDPYLDKYQELHARWGECDLPEVRLRLTNAMLMAMVMRRSDSPEFAGWVDRAWTMLHQVPDVNVTLQLFIGLLTLQTIVGDYAQAQSVLDTFRDAIPDRGPILPHLFHLNLRAFHCWSVGRFEEGLAAAERGMQLEADCGIRMLHTAIRTHAACAAIGLGRMGLARRYLDEAATALPREGSWVQGLYHGMRSWYELRQKNLAGAELHARIHYAKALAAGTSLTMPFSHGIMAAVLLQVGIAAEAKKHLAMGFQASRGFPGRIFAFQGYLLKARMALAEGDGGTAGQMLRRGLAVGAQRNYRYANHWQPEVMAELCVEALKRGIEPAYVRSLVVEHRLQPSTPPVDVPGWPWPLRITTLGGFSLEKNGAPLPPPRKAQQRPLAMLKYLVARGGKNIPAHEVEELLWPDADGDAASNAFSTTLHRLRRLVGNDQAISYSEAVLSLDPFLVWVDVQAFERCCQLLDHTLSRPGNADDLKAHRDILVSLYQGPFLPGESAAWAIPLRQRLQARFFSTLGALAHAFEEMGCLEDAEQCCRHGLSLDPLVESLYCPLMRI